MPKVSDDELAKRVAEVIGSMIPQMRGVSTHAIDAFTRSAEAGLGGTLLIVAPYRSRDLPEARFRSEGFQGIADQ